MPRKRRTGSVAAAFTERSTSVDGTSDHQIEHWSIVQLDEHFCVGTELYRRDNDVVVNVALTLSDTSLWTEDTVVALKQLRKTKNNAQEFYRHELNSHVRFCNPQHLNIVKCYPLFLETKDVYVLVVDYAAPGRMDKTYNAQSSHAETLQALLDVVHGLEHIHSLGAVHFDLKRSNVVCHKTEERDQPICKLIDFGSCHKIGAVVEVGLSMGFTRRYAAPELLENNSATHVCVSPAQDVWSLAIMALRVYDLELWHEATQEDAEYVRFSSFMRSCKKKPRPLKLEGAECVPQVIRRLLPRMLDPDPNTRVSLGEVKQDLVRELSKEALKQELLKNRV